MAGGSKPPNMQCTELKSGILLGEEKEVREGREEEREREGGKRDAEREEKRKKREVGRVLPFKGTGYCLPCMWGDCQVPQGVGPGMPGCKDRIQNK